MNNKLKGAEQKATFKAMIDRLKKETNFHENFLFSIPPRANELTVYFHCLICDEKLKISDHEFFMVPADIVIGAYDFDQLFDEMKKIINNHPSECVQEKKRR